jgi:WD40 repeat protein
VTAVKRVGLAALVFALQGCGSEPAAEPPPTGAAVGPTGPLATDIWLADLHWETSGPPAVGEPINLTQRPGYDNQPYFLSDGSGLWYTAVDTHDGQADIWRYDFDDGRVVRVTASSPESEYSATPLPDGSGISVVRVEADSTQRLWRFDADGTNGAVVLTDVEPIGYHAWADERTVVVYVLGEPATLRRVDVQSGRAEAVAEDVGRSIQSIPGTHDVSYVQRHPDGSSTIMRLPQGRGAPEPLTAGVEGGDFHTWAPDGTLLMAHEATVYAWTPGVDSGWVAIADFSRLRLTVTRLAVSPNSAQIALVGEVTF